MFNYEQLFVEPRGYDRRQLQQTMRTPPGALTELVRDLARRDSAIVRTLRIASGRFLYTNGEREPAIYFIESGAIKILVSGPDGKDVLLDIMITGELFGETALAPQPRRIETAVAAELSVVKRIRTSDLLAYLRHRSLGDELAVHLAERLIDLEQVVMEMATMNSERRLAAALLRLAHKSARGADAVLLSRRLSQDDLAQFVGTTRPRISAFMKHFRELGLVESKRRQIVVHISALSNFVRY